MWSKVFCATIGLAIWAVVFFYSLKYTCIDTSQAIEYEVLIAAVRFLVLFILFTIAIILIVRCIVHSRLGQLDIKFLILHLSIIGLLLGSSIFASLEFIE